jgi:hypothetical protein
LLPGAPAVLAAVRLGRGPSARLSVLKKRENSVAGKKAPEEWGKPVAIRGFFSAL